MHRAKRAALLFYVDEFGRKPVARLRSQLLRDEGEPVASSGRNSGRSRVARSVVASVPVAAPVAATKGTKLE
eukprot:11373584-Alexandrium_andersonii.AAC.1